MAKQFLEELEIECGAELDGFSVVEIQPHYGMGPATALVTLICEGSPSVVDEPPESYITIDELDPQGERWVVRLVDRFAAQRQRMGDAHRLHEYCGLSTECPAYVAASSWAEASTHESMWGLIELMKSDQDLVERLLKLFRHPLGVLEATPVASEHRSDLYNMRVGDVLAYA